MRSDIANTKQKPARPLWRLYRLGHDAACEVVIVPCGYEGRFLFDGRFLYSYQFTRPDEAVAWAGQKEEQCRQEGWTSHS